MVLKRSSSKLFNNLIISFRLSSFQNIVPVRIIQYFHYTYFSTVIHFLLITIYSSSNRIDLNLVLLCKFEILIFSIGSYSFSTLSSYLLYFPSFIQKRKNLNKSVHLASVFLSFFFFVRHRFLLVAANNSSF